MTSNMVLDGSTVAAMATGDLRHPDAVSLEQAVIWYMGATLGQMDELEQMFHDAYAATWKGLP